MLQINWHIQVRLFKSDLEKLIELCEDWIVDVHILSNKPDAVKVDKIFWTVILEKQDLDDTPF